MKTLSPRDSLVILCVAEWTDQLLSWQDKKKYAEVESGLIKYPVYDRQSLSVK